MRLSEAPEALSIQELTADKCRKGIITLIMRSNWGDCVIEWSPKAEPRDCCCRERVRSYARYRHYVPEVFLPRIWHGRPVFESVGFGGFRYDCDGEISIVMSTLSTVGDKYCVSGAHMEHVIQDTLSSRCHSATGASVCQNLSPSISMLPLESSPSIRYPVAANRGRECPTPA